MSTLPVELLVAIFQLILYDQNDFGRPRPGELYRLRLVCKTWNTIIETTSTFWSVLDDAAPPHWIELCAQRSRDAPLHVYFQGPFRGKEEEEYTGPSQTYLNLLSTTAYRWKTLDVHIKEVTQLPAAIQSLSAPQLVSVRFDIDNWDDGWSPEDGVVTILAGGTPLLTHLCIRTQTFNRNWMSFSQLKRLETLDLYLRGVDGLYDANIVPASTTIDILDSLQDVRDNLQRFILQGTFIEGPEVSPPRSAITLPQLHFLSADQLRPSLMHALLIPLRLPALRTVSLNIYAEATLADEAVGLTAAFLRSQSGWLSHGLDVRIQDVSINGGDDVYPGVRIALRKPELDVTIYLMDLDVDNWTSWFGRLCGTGARLPIEGPHAELVVHVAVGFRETARLDPDSINELNIHTGLARWLRPQMTTLELELPRAGSRSSTLHSIVAEFWSAALETVVEKIEEYRNLRVVMVPCVKDIGTVHRGFAEALEALDIEVKHSRHTVFPSDDDLS